ncbi:MAG: LytR C-terminal domain-containing protein [Pseudonocardia sp.]|nr:LytR C-terminal domain-containing protein [Pseudonocardia sp.]
MGGIALLGVGVIAAFAGLITTTQGNGDGTVAQGPAASAGALESAAPTEPAVASPSPDVARVVPAPAASAVPAPVEPAPPAVAAPAPAPGESSSVPHGSLRVYNNSLIQGLAARAAADFRSAGWTIAEIGSYPGETITTSTVYYRPGTDEQAAAQEIGRAFGLRVAPRFAEIQSASPGLIVIVTKEYKSPGKS